MGIKVHSYSHGGTKAHLTIISKDHNEAEQNISLKNPNHYISHASCSKAYGALWSEVPCGLSLVEFECAGGVDSTGLVSLELQQKFERAPELLKNALSSMVEATLKALPGDLSSQDIVMNVFEETGFEFFFEFYCLKLNKYIKGKGSPFGENAINNLQPRGVYLTMAVEGKFYP